MTGPEIVKFTAAVRDAFTSGDLSTLLKKLDRKFLDYVTEKSPFPDQVAELIGAANSKGWVSQLVLAVVDDRPNNQAIKDFLVLHPYWDPAKYPALTHPADTLRVHGGKSFVGRNVLREGLKKMDEPTGKKVMLVRSDHRKVGKTYSKDLILFISANLQPSNVAYVDLDAEKYDPIKLAKKIAREMRLDGGLIPDVTTEQAPRSNQDLVGILTDNTPNPSPIIWIVLDGFRDHVPSDPIQEFVVQLALKIQSMKEFRLVLLHYPFTLPLAVGGFTIKDIVEPLTRTELQTHLAKVHRQKHQSSPTPEELSEYLECFDEAMTKTLQENPEAAGDLLLVNLAVTTVAETIEEDAA